MRLVILACCMASVGCSRRIDDDTGLPRTVAAKMPKDILETLREAKTLLRDIWTRWEDAEERLAFIEDNLKKRPAEKLTVTDDLNRVAVQVRDFGHEWHSLKDKIVAFQCACTASAGNPREFHNALHDLKERMDTSREALRRAGSLPSSIGPGIRVSK